MNTTFKTTTDKIPTFQKAVSQVSFETITIAGMRVEHSMPAIRKFRFPFFFVHGMWCFGALFKYLMRALGEIGFECYAITLRGHGADNSSFKEIGRLSIKDHIKDVERVIEEINREIVLCGHSMGQLIAAHVARQNKGLIAAYIGLMGEATRYTFMGLPVYARMLKYVWQMIRHKPITLEVRDALELFFNGFDRDRAIQHIRSLCPESSTVLLEVACWKYRQPPLDCPALLIEARDDLVTPYQRGVAKQLHAEHQVVPASHMAILEPDLKPLVETIYGWLVTQLAIV